MTGRRGHLNVHDRRLQPLRPCRAPFRNRKGKRDGKVAHAGDTPLAYDADVEQPKPDEAAAIASINASMNGIRRTTWRDCGHPSPRGLAMKIIGVQGDRLPGSEDDATQDFIMVNGPAFVAPNAQGFSRSLKLLAATTDTGQARKKALSAVLRGAVTALSARALVTGPRRPGRRMRCRSRVDLLKASQDVSVKF